MVAPTRTDGRSEESTRLRSRGARERTGVKLYRSFILVLRETFLNKICRGKGGVHFPRQARAIPAVTSAPLLTFHFLDE